MPEDEDNHAVPTHAVIRQVTCTHCGYTWFPKTTELPLTCANPKCRSKRWNQPRMRNRSRRY